MVDAEFWAAEKERMNRFCSRTREAIQRLYVARSMNLPPDVCDAIYRGKEGMGG